MKKIMLVSILLAISVLAYSQEIQGIWTTQIQIYEDFLALNDIDTALDRLPDDAIVIIQFDEEFGNVTFRSGRENRFLWKMSKWGIYLNYLTKKQDIYIASAQAVIFDYSFVDEETLILKYDNTIFDDPSHFISILKRIPSE